MVAIGIDADTRRLAYAVVSDGAVTAVREILRSTARGVMAPDYDQRLTALMRCAQTAGARVYLEDTYLAAGDQENVTVLKALVEVAGEIKGRARQHAVPVVSVGANVWRSAVLGATTGRERLKVLARERAVHYASGAVRDRELGELTEHECEAVCIAQYGAIEEGDGTAVAG